MRSIDPKKASEETIELNRIYVGTGEGSDKGLGRDGRLETVATGGATHPPVDVRVVGAIGAG